MAEHVLSLYIANETIEWESIGLNAFTGDQVTAKRHEIRELIYNLERRRSSSVSRTRDATEK